MAAGWGGAAVLHVFSEYTAAVGAVVGGLLVGVLASYAHNWLQERGKAKAVTQAVARASGSGLLDILPPSAPGGLPEPERLPRGDAGGRWDRGESGDKGRA